MSMKIVNSATVQVKISQGSAGIYVPRRSIDPGKSFPLKVDANETYCEYLFTTVPENLLVRPSSLSSDDIAGCSKIEIKEMETPEADLVWIGTPTTKKLGVSSKSRDQPFELPIVNSLTN